MGEISITGSGQERGGFASGGDALIAARRTVNVCASVDGTCDVQRRDHMPVERLGSSTLASLRATRTLIAHAFAHAVSAVRPSRKPRRDWLRERKHEASYPSETWRTPPRKKAGPELLACSRSGGSHCQNGTHQCEPTRPARLIPDSPSRRFRTPCPPLSAPSGTDR